MFFRKSNRSTDWLDDPLFNWPTGDPYTVRHALTSCAIKGITGAGKSKGSFLHMVRATVAHPRSTLLAIAQKEDDRDMIVEEFKRAGKRDKLIVMDDKSNTNCPFFEVLFKGGADDRTLTEFLVNQGQSLHAGLNNQGDNALYFRQLEDRIIMNTLGALRMAGKPPDAASLRDFVATAAYSHADLSSEEWKSRFHSQIMRGAFNAPKGDIDAIDYQNIRTFFENEFVNLDEKPRSGAISGLMNTAHFFASGMVNWRCSRGGDLSPAVRHDGFSVVVCFPYSQHGPSGKFISGGMKFLWEWDILRTKPGPGSYFTIIAADEFQELFTESDARFIGLCRSNLGGFLTATQTTSSELAAMGNGIAGQHKAAVFTSNHGHHIYHTVDAITAKAASESLGVRLQYIPNPSPRRDQELFDQMTGKAENGISMSGQYLPILQPTVFMTGLRNGGPSNDYLVDAIVVRPGTAFSNKENWIRVTFRQR